MATNTSSPTPSEDNRQNSRDDIMYSALDKVMSNDEQSYEDFLKTFTYLKQGSKGSQNEPKKVEVKKTAAVQSKVTSSKESFKLQRGDAGKLSEQSKPKQSTTNDDIEEEVLSEGDRTSRINKTKVIRTGSLVKFDNFVDPVDVEDLVEEEGYTASFGEDNTNTEKTSRVEGAVQSSRSGQAQLNAANSVESGVVDSQLSLDEQSTDKLLMNFLADLQNELNEGKTTEKADRESTAAPMDIQNFLDKKRKVTTKVFKETAKVSEEVNFDDEDEDDAMNLLLDDSEKRDIKVKISEQELKDVEKSDDIEENERRTRFGNIYRDSLMDSEGKVRTIQAERSESEHELANTEVEVAKVDNIIFPGQVEETSDPPVMENDTLLEFKATYKESDESMESQVDNTDDCIQPFQLDEDFDYDNVVLAPKFSSHDLKQLKMSNVKPQTVVM